MITENEKIEKEKWVPETELAERLGVPIERLRAARELVASPASIKKEGRKILLDERGAQIVAEAIAPGVPMPDAPEAQECPKDDCLEVRVTKIPLNPRLVFADWMGERVRVRVPDSKKFVPGMPMKARQIEGDLYELIGRGPRFKGRW